MKMSACQNNEEFVIKGRYKIIKQLPGQSILGNTFLVEDRKASGEIKLKVLKQTYVGELSAVDLEILKRESEKLIEMKHPCLLKVFDSFIDSNTGHHYLLMEYTKHGNLTDKIQTLAKLGIRFTETQVMQMLCQLLMGLDHMHSRGILHRNVKPNNIFVNHQNLIKLGDFTISVIMSSAINQDDQPCSPFIRTPHHLGPEVLQHDGYSSKSDIWSMGCVIHEMCGQQHTFEGGNMVDVLYTILEGPIPELPENFYSNKIGFIIDRMLDKDYTTRPSAMQLLKLPEIQYDLMKFLIELQTNHEQLKNDIPNNITALLQEKIRPPPQRVRFSDQKASAAQRKSRKSAELLKQKKVAETESTLENKENSSELAEVEKQPDYTDLLKIALAKRENCLTKNEELPFCAKRPRPKIDLPFEKKSLEATVAQSALLSARRDKVAMNPHSGLPTLSTTYKRPTTPRDPLYRQTSAQYHKALYGFPVSKILPDNAEYDEQGLEKFDYRSAIFEVMHTPLECDKEVLDNQLLVNIDLSAGESGTFREGMGHCRNSFKDYVISESELEEEDGENAAKENEEEGNDMDAGMKPRDEVAELFYSLRDFLCVQQKVKIQENRLFDTDETFVEDDFYSGIYGRDMKLKKLHQLKQHCLSKFGEDKYRSLYQLLRDERIALGCQFRTMDKTVSEFRNKMKKIWKNSADYFPIEEIIFLELNE